MFSVPLGKTSFESKHFGGKLVIKSKHSQHKVVIPYVAHVLEGGLEFNASVTQYCSDLGLNLGIRNFTVTNGFKIPVALVNVTLPKEAQAHFMVRSSFCLFMFLTVVFYSKHECCFGQAVIFRFLKHMVWSHCVHFFVVCRRENKGSL